MALITQEMSLTVRVLVETPDDPIPQSEPNHVSENIQNIFLAMTVGASDLDESYFDTDFALEIEKVHPGTTASVVFCTSTDPTNHQGDTCPVHEGDGS